MSDPLKVLKEFVDLAIEGKIREVDVSDGTKTKHGSRRHIKDLESRIESLSKWRDKEKRGSERRANYTRLIQRLKSELASAKRAMDKKKADKK